MTPQQVSFKWEVPAAGFRWVQVIPVNVPEHPQQTSKRPQPALVPVAGSAADAPAFTPEPDPALFLAFSEVKPDKAGILEFAGRHGNLFEVPLVPASRTDSVSGQPLHGVSLDAWQLHIGNVQRLVGLWDLLRREDHERLTQHIRWEKSKEGLSVRFDSHPGASRGEGPTLGFRRSRSVIASPAWRPELLATFEPDDPLLPAWAYLQQELHGLLFHANVEFSAEMVWDQKRRRPALRLEALTLMSAVYFQLADAVGNDRTFSRCRQCGRWFAVAPDAARTHRRFCSDGCRSKAYRGRQDRARQLFTAGKSFKEIARELDSDVATVTKWVTGFKP
jgi:hypothetical protein